MKYSYKNSKKDIKDFGEVFTPTFMVNQMLDKLPIEVFKENKTFLDNSCGNGQFLFEILKRKMENGFSHEKALSQIYGIELSEKNTIECKKRLSLGSDDQKIWEILDHNIINADALDPAHEGWVKVGFYWSNN